jgi:HEPN domain-containing protein
MSDYDQIEYWDDLAHYDFETAKVMYKGRRYLYVGFMCHQCIEKGLKAAFLRENPPENLPYIHNLLRIAESCSILNKMDDMQKSMLAKLEPLNMEARYPKQKDEAFAMLTKEYCSVLLSETESLLKWIKKQ